MGLARLMHTCLNAGDTPASSSQGSQGSGRRGGLPLDGDYPRCLSRVRHNVYRIRCCSPTKYSKASRSLAAAAIRAVVCVIACCREASCCLLDRHSVTTITQACDCALHAAIEAKAGLHGTAGQPSALHALLTV